MMIFDIPAYRFDALKEQIQRINGARPEATPITLRVVQRYRKRWDGPWRGEREQVRFEVLLEGLPPNFDNLSLSQVLKRLAA